ncbi:MAG: Unknown protein [uncultured Sulfurovum sp.]|uniref:PD-(D/E)XK nuclease superfamily protein n=1 Tax=uncultured Sulfurovum sp. TaxID=269237 RepID=A0A6S6UFT3_9BACT|nr:MAG: Unknown protein [uncultured Sulfurovum sp.]
MNTTETLLDNLTLKYQKYQELHQLSLNSFNIFSILRKSNDEVNLHSKFIFELLNPNGSHQQGNRFLKLFFEELSLEEDAFTYEVFREKFNIDILLTAKKSAIIIENKIDTEDHSNQLSRYYEEIKGQGYKEKEIKFFYLTLFDEVPNESKMQKHVKNITYKYEIRNWIEACIKEVIKLPILRDTLVQYLNLVNQLTEQSQEKGFTMEIKNMLLEKNNLETILSIEEAVIEAKIEVQLKFWQSLMEALNRVYSFKFYALNGEKNLKKSVNKYYKKRKNRKDFGFEYQVDDNLYFFIELRSHIYYGFDFRTEDKRDQEERVNTLWVDWEENYWKYSPKPLNFELFNTTNVLALIDNNKQKKVIDEISDEIFSLIHQYQNFNKEAS